MTTDGSPGGDVSCPSCGEPVGVRATYCMHCGRDLPDRVEYDDVTDGGAGETLLERLRPGDADSDAESVHGTTASLDWDAADGTVGAEQGSPLGASGSTDPSISLPSGRGSDGPTLVPVGSGLDRPRDAVRFLGALALVGLVAVLGFGLSFTMAGVSLAMIAWVGSVASVVRHRTGFDAMRYGTSTLMLTLIFVSFALAFGGDGVGLAPVALALVPVAIATLLVAGFGRTITDAAPT